MPRVEWTEERKRFMRIFIPGHTEQEIRTLFEHRFGITLNSSQIKNIKAKLGVKSGTHGGRFEKGRVPFQKGKTWEEQGRSKESNERSLSTCFKKGNVPHNAKDKPIGYERVNRDGYVEVKIADRPSNPYCNDNFKAKHRLVWEQANGRPVPPSTVIVFADGDKGNFDPDNLVAVPRSAWSLIQREGYQYTDRETLLRAVDIANLRSSIFKARCRKRKCRKCGETFKPRFPHQRTCDECLGRD